MLDLTKYDGMTPGPWRIDHGDRDGDTWIYVGCDAKILITLSPSPRSCAEDVANVRAIADAPKMIAEIRRLREALSTLEKAASKNSGDQWAIDACAEARAALEEAK